MGVNSLTTRFRGTCLNISGAWKQPPKIFVMEMSRRRPRLNWWTIAANTSGN